VREENVLGRFPAAGDGDLQVARLSLQAEVPGPEESLADAVSRAEFRVFHDGGDSYYAMYEKGEGDSEPKLTRKDAFPVTSPPSPGLHRDRDPCRLPPCWSTS